MNAIQPLTIENFASLARSGSATRVYIREYTPTDGGGWFVDVDHLDSRQTTKLHTERGSLRVFRTADAAIKAVKEAGFSRSIVQSSAAVPDVAEPSTNEAGDAMGGLVRMDARRQRVAVDAATELEVLARLLPRLVPDDGENSHESHYAVRGVAGRVLRLASVLLSSLSDESEATVHLEDVLNIDCGQG